MTPNQVVAYNVAKARALRGWTQEQAAEALAPYLGPRLSGRQLLGDRTLGLAGRPASRSSTPTSSSPSPEDSTFPSASSSPRRRPISTSASTPPTPASTASTRSSCSTRSSAGPTTCRPGSGSSWLTPPARRRRPGASTTKVNTRRRTWPNVSNRSGSCGRGRCSARRSARCPMRATCWNGCVVSAASAGRDGCVGRRLRRYSGPRRTSGSRYSSSNSVVSSTRPPGVPTGLGRDPTTSAIISARRRAIRSAQRGVGLDRIAQLPEVPHVHEALPGMTIVLMGLSAPGSPRPALRPRGERPGPCRRRSARRSFRDRDRPAPG